VRPFLPGQPNRSSSVDHIEEGNISIIAPLKYSREGKKSFTFNKVFGPSATQGMFLQRRYFEQSIILSSFLTAAIIFCRGGICRHPTSDSVCSWWLQCLYICLWTNRIRENLYYGKRFTTSSSYLIISFTIRLWFMFSNEHLSFLIVLLICLICQTRVDPESLQRKVKV